MGAQEGGRGGIIVERDNRGEYHMGNMTLHARERSLRLQGGRGRRGGAGGDVGRKWDPLGGEATLGTARPKEETKGRPPPCTPAP